VTDTFEIGRTLSRAWQIALRSLPSAGLFLLIATVVSKLLGMAAMFALRSQFQPTATADPLAALKVFGSVSYLAITLVSLALAAFTYAGTLYGLVQSAPGRAASVTDCVGVGLAKLLPILGFIILWYIAIIASLLALVVPGIILIVMWSAALPVLVNEDTGVIGAFGRSRALTKGSRGRIFLMLLLCLIVVYGGLFGLLGLILGTNLIGMGPAIAVNPLLSLAQIPFSWAVTLAINALLASIYLETLAIKGGGPAGHLDEVFA
jgi:hypothetical protein